MLCGLSIVNSVVFAISELDVDDAALATVPGNVCAVGFVGVDMHREGELIADADDDVAEDRLSAVGIYRDADDVLILDARFFRDLGSHVDVALCDYQAFGKGDAAFGAFDLDGRGALKIAALADERLGAEADAVGLADLDLGRLADGPEDGDALDLALAVLDGDLFLAEELAGLGKGAVESQLVTFAKQSLYMLLSEMHVTCGNFNDEIHSVLLNDYCPHGGCVPFPDGSIQYCFTTFAMKMQ